MYLLLFISLIGCVLPRAVEHGRAVIGAMGGPDADDVLALLDGALADPSLPLDGARVGVMGGSYGGYMTALLTTRTDRFAAFFHAMLDQGVHLPPSAYEVWFLSAAHDDAAVDRVLAALPDAARAAAAVPDPS